MNTAHGAISIQLFGINLLKRSGKLDHFINGKNVSPYAMKISSFQNIVSKIALKKFYRVNPRLGIHKFSYDFLTIILSVIVAREHSLNVRLCTVDLLIKSNCFV